MAKKDAGGDGGGRLADVLKYANELGFESVVERGSWKKSTVYELVLSASQEDAYTGIPQYVIDSGKKLKVASLNEAFEILDSLNEAEEAEEDV